MKNLSSDLRSLASRTLRPPSSARVEDAIREGTQRPNVSFWCESVSVLPTRLKNMDTRGTAMDRRRHLSSPVILRSLSVVLPTDAHSSEIPATIHPSHTRCPVVSSFLWSVTRPLSRRFSPCVPGHPKTPVVTGSRLLLWPLLKSRRLRGAPIDARCTRGRSSAVFVCGRPPDVSTARERHQSPSRPASSRRCRSHRIFVGGSSV